MYTDNLPEKLSIAIILCSFISTHLCYQGMMLAHFKILKIVFGGLSLFFLIALIETGTALWLKNIRQEYLHVAMPIAARLVQFILILQGLVFLIRLLKLKKDNNNTQTTAT